MFAKGTILVVDDEVAVLRLIEITLKRAGYHVFAVSDGREALRYVRQVGNQVDVAILDGIMPGMSGPDLLSGLREASPELPVLFVSGFAADKELRAMTGERLLKKPFTAAQLLQRVEEAIATSGSDSAPKRSRGTRS